MLKFYAFFDDLIINSKINIFLEVHSLMQVAQPPPQTPPPVGSGTPPRRLDARAFGARYSAPRLRLKGDLCFRLSLGPVLRWPLGAKENVAWVQSRPIMNIYTQAHGMTLCHFPCHVA